MEGFGLRRHCSKQPWLCSSWHLAQRTGLFLGKAEIFPDRSHISHCITSGLHLYVLGTSWHKMDSTAMSPSFQRFQPVSTNKSLQLCTPQRLLSVKVSFRPPFPTRPCEDGLCRSLPKAIREKLQPIRSLRTEVRTGRLGDLESWEVEKLDEDG